MTNATVKKPCGHPVLDLNRPLSRERRCWACVRANAKVFLEDPYVKRYITVIRQKPRSGGILSRSTRTTLCLSIFNFMQYLEVDSPSNLIALKVDQAPNHFTLENSLEEWASLRSANKTYAQIIRGFFRANRRPLNVYIDSHTVDRRPPPSEDRLKHIFHQATLEEKALMALQLESGERVRAVAMTTPSDLPDLQISQSLHVVVFTSSRTKLHREHLSYYSEDTARLLRQLLQSKDIRDEDPFFANYQILWKKITDYSRSKGTYLKSHHLRKRFVHLAQRTPIPIPDIDYLMGDSKKGVHCAEAYSYTLHDELALEYEEYLLPILPLISSVKESSTPDPSQALLSEVSRTNTLMRELIKLIRDRIKLTT